MRYIGIFSVLLLLLSCNNKSKENDVKSVEEYRAIASKADQEALRLWKIQQKYEEEQLDIVPSTSCVAKNQSTNPNTIAYSI